MIILFEIDSVDDSTLSCGVMPCMKCVEMLLCCAVLCCAVLCCAVL